MEQAFLDFGQQHGPWAAFCILMFIACSWLVKYVLAASDKREAALQRIVADQNIVISKQSEAVESQSVALNKITENLERLDRSVSRIENSLERIER